MTRNEREIQTVRLMISLYCRHHHTRQGLCAECAALAAYATARIMGCPQSAAKRSCRICPIHCYSPQRREQIRQVMRYAGPRMLFFAPIKALRHFWSEKFGR